MKLAKETLYWKFNETNFNLLQLLPGGLGPTFKVNYLSRKRMHYRRMVTIERY